MSRVSKQAILGCAGAAVLAAGWALGDVIVLDPGVISGQATVSGETVTQYQISAVSPASGLSAEQSFTTSTYALTVEDGHSYRPRAWFYFNHPGTNYSRLQVQRTGQVAVNADAGPSTVNFSYEARRVTATIQVTGGVVRGYELRANATQAPETYAADTYKAPVASATASAVTDWVAMVPHASVQVSGTAYVTTSDGVPLTITLPAQFVNLTPGPASVTWPLDLTSTGTLAGTIAIGPDADVASRSVFYYGVNGTPTAAVSGSIPVTGNGLYSLLLPPGQYDVWVRTYFKNPYYLLDSQSQRITIATAQTLVRNFSPDMAVIRNALSVGGVFDASDVNQGEIMLYGADRSQRFHASARDDANAEQYDLRVTAGTWELYVNRVWFNDNSDPGLRLNGYYQRQHAHNQHAPTITVTGGEDAVLELPELFLGEANVYLDVEEPAGAPAVTVSHADVRLTRQERDSSNAVIVTQYGRFHGSTTPSPLAGLRIAVEPGTYTVDAFARVGGATVEFPAGGQLTVYEPRQTEIGADQPVTLVEEDDLTVELEFDNVTEGGFTTVTESGLGPHPPGGFQAACTTQNPIPGLDCAPRFYDIKTTAEFSDSVEVCITAEYTGPNKVHRFLELLHYDTDSGAWEEITGTVTLVSYNPATRINVIEICGETDSFSPFAVFQKSVTLQSTDEGPDGEIQQWTVPATGRYRIHATGAQGGHATTGTAVGGCGASLGGEFDLQEGDVLDILVGQKGGVAEYSGGGGGGTFVVRDGLPLLAVGGGGGVRADATQNGRPGSPQAAGVAGSLSASYSTNYVAGGSAGQGGSSSESWGSGGGGFHGAGASDESFGEGGHAYQDGGAGGVGYGYCGEPAHGGYGGGGSGDGCDGGGGGGGYSGGGAGWVAGGGGSYNAGLNPTSKPGGFCTPTGHGQVVIDLVGD